MFREMRRKKQSLPEDICLSILRQGSCGVLATVGDDDYPYAVPLSYVYQDGKIFFHCAKTGHKLDGIHRNAKVSFCVVNQDQVVAEKFTTYYRSVIVFGKARVLEDKAEKQAAIEILAKKYSPNEGDKRTKEIDRLFDELCMLELTIEHMTGKEAKELTIERKS